MKQANASALVRSHFSHATFICHVLFSSIVLVLTMECSILHFYLIVFIELSSGSTGN